MDRRTNGRTDRQWTCQTDDRQSDPTWQIALLAAQNTFSLKWKVTNFYKGFSRFKSIEFMTLTVLTL